MKLEKLINKLEPTQFVKIELFPSYCFVGQVKDIDKNNDYFNLKVDKIVSCGKSLNIYLKK